MYDSNDGFVQVLKFTFVCVLCFGPSLMFSKQEFVYDDDAAVVRNPDVIKVNRSFSEVISAIGLNDYWGQDLGKEDSHQSFRPVITFIHHMEYRYFHHENMAAVMKRTNLLLHIAICCILYEILRRLFREYDQTIISNAMLLFAVHPIHTEVICSVVGRADLNCAIFFMAVVDFYAEAARVTDGLTSIRTFLILSGSLVSFFSKEIGIMALPLCCFIDITSNFELPSIPKDDVQKRFEILLISCKCMILRLIKATSLFLVNVLLRGVFTSFVIPTFTDHDNPIAVHPSFFTRLFSSLYVHALNAWLLLCPDWLSCDWSHDSIRLIESWTDYRIILAILFYIILIGTFYQGPRFVRIAILIMVIPFIPCSQIVTVGFVLAERLLYIPSIGFCLLIAFGFHYLTPNYPKIMNTIFYMLIALLMLRTCQRTIDWQNNTNLFKSAIDVVPNNAKMYYNLATAEADNGNNHKAINNFLIALEKKPDDVKTLVNLGNSFRHVGYINEALSVHTKATQLNPGHANAWKSLAISYIGKGKLNEALHSYIMAYKLDPLNENLSFNMGNLYIRTGDIDSALIMFRRTLNINPKSERAHKNLIILLSQYGTKDKVIHAIENAELTTSNNIRLITHIANHLSSMNFDFDVTLKLYQRILDIDTGNVNAHGQLAILYGKRNLTKHAMKHFQKTRELHATFTIDDQKFAELDRKWNAAMLARQKRLDQLKTKPAEPVGKITVFK